MTSAHWQQLESLFQAALERPVGERAAFLAQACAGDAALLQEAEKLLASFDSADDFLETPAADSLGLAGAAAVTPGQHIAHYAIISALGAGGMGEVYLAQDTRLKRPIALKLLSARFMHDAQFVERFEHEARAASALNHPNIITVHDIGCEAGVHFIATEFIEGETLRARLSRAPLAVKETLTLAAQITEALAAAHAVGLIHRDIKPENVMIRPDGLVKVLDFGLAKLAERETGKLVTLERASLSAQTDPRVLLGTLRYLAPEQVRHEAVNQRTDIFSLGVVLYEMLTRQQPFSGATATEVLSAIQHETPAPLPHAVPAALSELVSDMLAKDATDRPTTTLEVRQRLQRLQRQFEPASSEDVRKRWFKPAFVLIGLICLMFGWLFWQQWRAPAAVTKGEKTSPWLNDAKAVRLTGYPGTKYFPTLSPDGQSLVYARQISLQYDLIWRRIDDAQERNLTEDSPVPDFMPAFAPDGVQLAFRSNRNGGGIFVMKTDGSGLRQITREGFYPAWSSDGQEIVYDTEGPTSPHLRYSVSQLRIVNVATGAQRGLATGDAVQPHWSPSGARIAYWGLRGTQRDLWTVAARGGEPVPVTNDVATDWNPVWSPDGKYLYYTSANQGTMRFWRVPIDEASGQVLGAPEAVTGASSESWHPTLSRDGRRLVYAQYNTKENLQRLDFDAKSGRASGVATPITAGERRVTSPCLSPDGAWLAFYSFGNPQEDLFVIRPDGGGQRQLTNDRFSDRARGWSPDGQRVLFASDRSGNYEIWEIGLNDGLTSGAMRQLTWCGGRGCAYADWSPDGKWLAVYRDGQHSFLLDATQSWQAQTPRVLPPLSETTDEHFLVWSWSPDSQRLAGTQRHPNGAENGLWIYSLATQRYERLANFGTDPHWLNDNRRVLFVAQRRLWLVNRTSPEPPRVLLRLDPLGVTKAVLSPDNRLLYFSQISTESDLWMLQLP